jgi:hypothetical protein
MELTKRDGKLCNVGTVFEAIKRPDHPIYIFSHQDGVGDKQHMIRETLPGRSRLYLCFSSSRIERSCAWCIVDFKYGLPVASVDEPGSDSLATRKPFHRGIGPLGQVPQDCLRSLDHAPASL